MGKNSENEKEIEKNVKKFKKVVEGRVGSNPTLSAQNSVN